MKTKKKKSPLVRCAGAPVKKITFTIAPERGAAALVSQIDGPPGYQFWKMERVGTKATVYFRRIEASK